MLRRLAVVRPALAWPTLGLLLLGGCGRTGIHGASKDASSTDVATWPPRDGASDGVPGGDGGTPTGVDGVTGCTPGTFSLGGLSTPQLPGAPTAIAVGDLDGDGKADLAVTFSETNTVGVLLGRGDGTFSNTTLFQSGSRPRSVAIGDLNADGKVDLAVSNDEAGTISIFVALGGGAFATKLDYPVGKHAGSVAIGDTNGDGHLDVAVANPEASTVTVLLGQGDGSLAKATAYTVGDGPQALAVGDLDADGRADIAVPNRGSSYLSLLFGQRDGSFIARTLDDTSNSVVIADFDGDGDLDLVSADGNAARAFLNRGDGTFAPPVDYPAGPTSACPAYNLTVGDMDADGRPDLAWLNDDCDDIAVSLNRGNGTFAAPDVLAVGDYPYLLVTGDFNGDRRTDVMMAAGLAHLTPLLAQPNGSMKPDWFVDEPVPYATVATGDFNRDGRPDLVVVNDDASVSVLSGQADGTLIPGAPIPVRERSVDFSAVDINGDRALDLVYLLAGTVSTMSVLVNQGGGSFAAQVDTQIDPWPLARRFGDLDGDGAADLVVSSLRTNELAVFINQGAGRFAAGAKYTTDGHLSNFALGDLNDDGKLDLAISSSMLPGVLTMLGKGDGTFGVAIDCNSTGTPGAVAIADVSGDAIADLILLKRAPNAVSVLLGGKDFPGAWLDSTLDFYPDGFAGIADVDGDEATDLAVLQGRTVLFIVRGRGDGTFVGSLGYSVIGASWLVWADFDGNGRLDLGTPEYVNGLFRWNVYANNLCR
jgi:hypothetical protein